MSNKHTRKSFFARGLAALAGLGVLGGARLAAKPANSSSPASSGDAASAPAFPVKVDSRSVARSGDSL